MAVDNAPSAGSDPDRIQSHADRLAAAYVDADDERERLRQERDFWRGLFEQTIEEFPEPLLVVDDEKRLTHWNEAHETFMGVDRDEALGRTALDVTGTEGVDETLAGTVVRTGERIIEDDHRTGQTTDGDPWHVQVSGVPLRSPEGEVVGCLSLANRVTDLVEAREHVASVQERLAGEVRAAAADLDDATEAVVDSADEIAAVADEQSSSMVEVADDVSAQSAATEQIAARASEVAELSAEAEELAAKSLETAEAAGDSMAALAEVGDRVTESVRELGDHVDELDEVIELIGGLANRTGILALNANIEAARSDGDGEGFAVVADEIKELASRSQSEVEEIEDLVAEMTARAETAVEQVEESTERVEAGRERVTELMEHQQRIADTSTETAAGMDEIEEATDDQARRAERVSERVETARTRAEDVEDRIDAVVEAANDQTEVTASLLETVRTLERELDEG